MSILDSFFFILRADTRDAERGLNRAGQGFDDLRETGEDATRDVSRGVSRMGADVARGADAASEAISGFRGELLDLAKDAAIAATGGYSVVAMWERIQRLSDTANNARALNIDVSEYDTIEKVLQSVGYEAEETRDLFVDLAEAIGEGAGDAESGRAKTFKDLGVSLKDANGNTINATQGFRELAKAVDGLSPEKAIFMLRQLGINDPKLLTLLTQGNAEMQKRIALVQRYGVMNQAQADAAMDLQKAQQLLTANLASIGEAMARGLLPAIAGVFRALNVMLDYINDHRIAFTTFFGVGATVISVALLPAIWSAVQATRAWAVATIAATWPWLALAAAVAAVAIAAEDLYLYFTDPTANTVTGELVKKFPELGKVLAECRDELESLINWFVELKAQATQTWDDIINGINELNPQIDKLIAGAREAFTGLFSWIRQLGLEIGDFFRDMFAGIINGIVDQIPEAAQKVLGITKMRTGAERRLDEQAGSLAGDVAAITGPQAEAVNGNLPNVSASPAAANAVISQASSSPINSVAGTSVTSSSKVVETNAPVHIDRMEIHTQSTDPEAINSAVTGGLQEQWKNAVQQRDDGISH